MKNELERRGWDSNPPLSGDITRISLFCYFALVLEFVEAK
jgi:hypothetical protein